VTPGTSDRFLAALAGREAIFFPGVNDAATASRLLLSDARPSLTRSIEKTLDGVRALGPDRVIELADDRSAHRISVEDQTGNPSSDQQYWRDREQGALGQ
jgi:hypothetical protein